MAARNFSFWTKIRILYANPMLIFGTVWLAFSMIFMVVFTQGLNLADEIALRNSDSLCNGKIVSKEETNARINKRDVWAYTIHYQVNGANYEVVSFTTKKHKEGEKVRVIYVANTPEIAVAEDMTKSTFGMTALFVAIFPLIGLLIFGFGIRSGLKNLHIILHGEIALGKYVSEEPTNASVNKHTVMKMKFTFTDRYGKEQITYVETHETSHLRDEALEVLLYLPESPLDSVFPDTLAKIVRRKLEPEIQRVKNKYNATL